MKSKVFVFGSLVVLLFCLLTYEHTQAESGTNLSGSKVGIVSVLKIFQECEKNADYRQQATAEQERILSELEKLSKEIEADKAGLNTLKPGTDEHLELMKQILKKQGELEARREFAKQQLALKDQRWTVQIYKQIVSITQKIAEEKALDLVLEKGDIDTIDNSTTNELMLTIRTHKVLYSGGCLDITDEVMARLDAVR